MRFNTVNDLPCLWIVCDPVKSFREKGGREQGPEAAEAW